MFASTQFESSAPPRSGGFSGGPRSGGGTGFWRPLALLLLVAAMAGATAARAAESARRRPAVFVAVPDPGMEVAGAGGGAAALAVTDEVLVRFRPEAMRRAQALEARFGAEHLRWLGPRRRGVGPAAGLAGLPPAGAGLDGLATVRLAPGTDLARGLADLQRMPDVLFAEPNYRVELTATPARLPNDIEFPRQWGLRNTGQTGGRAGADIGAPEAWRFTTGERKVVVAIVDTGIDYFHPDLEPNLWANPREIPGNGIDDDGNGYIDDVRGFDFVTDDGDPMDDNLHGTHVAGILGAVGDDEQGVAGVAWSVQLMALKAFDESGAGTLDDTIEAVGYAIANGARVINASWGLTARSRALDEIVASAVKAGVVFVAAAGNNGSTVRFFPAAVPEAIAVGASDAKDGSPTFSNYGPFVDLVAPGDSIQSTAPNASWTMLSGTSMAAPYVSGTVALLLSRRPEFTPDEIGMILKSTADELDTDRFTGAGRLNAGRAVAIDEPLPTARLAVPAQWSGLMDVGGEAGGHRFAGYRLELGAGTRPAEWIELGGGSVASTGGVLLGGLDTARFDDGEYTVRLVVTNLVGQSAVERVPVAIRNVRLVSPLNNDVARHGGVLELRGTVFGDGRVFGVEWGYGRAPTEWRTNGLALSNDGAAPIVDGLLGTWDTGVVAPNAFVTFRLTARREGRTVGDAWARMVHLGDLLRTGWPRRFDFNDEFPSGNWREFNVADLDGDGSAEIVLVDHGESGGRPPRLVVLAADGSVRWTRDLPAGDPEFDAPAIGDVDGDGRNEIFVDTGTGGRISAFDAEGRPLGGRWPVAPGGTHLGKIVVDLDGDGRAEIVTLSNPPPELEDSRTRVLSVLSGTGEVLRQWNLSRCPDSVEVPEQLPAVANLDDDATLEIVAVDGCLGVSAFDLDQPSRPIWTASTEANLFASPITGDLDGDGYDEVVIGGVARSEGQPGGVWVFNRNGKVRRGWPALTPESFPATAALADLDGDGRLDIVLPDWDSDVVHALGADGFELKGWPTPKQVNGSVRSLPVIGDVNGDGLLDVVLASPGHWLSVVLSGDTSRAGGVRAWHADGRTIDFQPFEAADGLIMESSGGAMLRLPPAALADLDGDGTLDVVAGTVQDSAYSPTPPVTQPKMRSSLYAWALPVPAPSPRLAGWPQAHGGPGRSGRFRRERPPNRPPVVLEIPNQTVAQGAAFRPIPLDRYVADPDDRENRLTWSATGGAEVRVEIGPDRVARPEARRADWEGTETIEFTVRDPAGAVASTRVILSVRAGYVPPVAAPDFATGIEDGTVELRPLANDLSPTGRPIRLAGVSRPGSGTVEMLADGLVRYRPATNFFGVDHFEYTLVDDDGGFATGEVEVTVVGAEDPPVAVEDRLIIDEDTVGELSVLENDLDPDGDLLTLVAVEEPSTGVVERAGEGLVRFRPPPDFSGLSTFHYTIRDPSGLTATGEVAVLVRPVNDPPIARNQSVTLNRNRATPVIYDASDVDGDTLSYTIVDAPTNGVLLVYPTVANYEPRKGFSGSDRFTYTVSDGHVSVGPVTVNLTVHDANNPPDVESVSAVTAVDQPLALGLPVSDADGEAVVLHVEGAAPKGSVEFSGTNLVYTPAPGFLGEDRFDYRASDGIEASAMATVSVRVTDENTAPVAFPDVLVVARNATSPVVLRARDAENNPLTFELVADPEHGVLEGEPPRLRYTPRANFRGIDRFGFVARDRWVTSEVALVHLLVRDPNQTPVTTNETVTVRRDVPRSFRLQATDADGQRLRAAILKGPRSGRLYGSGIDFTYAPAAGFVGSDTFTYKVWDGFTYSAVATVTLVVSVAPPPPVQSLMARRVDGGIEISVQTTGANRVRLESSTDLDHWETVSAWEHPEGILRWVDPGSGSASGRYFRAVGEAE